MTTQVRCLQCSKEFPAHVVGQFGGMCPACIAGFAEVPEGSLLKPGSTFGRYEILDVLGRGGMGVVYKARQTGLDRVVALKILSERLAADPSFVERFRREANTLASLNHANIVAIHDYGVEGDAPFLVMEYVEGVSLRRLIAERRLPPEEAFGIVSQLCEALEYAHSGGVVHRDVKPENILIDTKGRVKIADFGLAVMLGLEATRLTQTDSVMGTPHYMAPEQVENPKSVDHRADIYSMGVVFYEMLTGELPLGRFAMPSAKARVHRRLDEIVLRALEKEPEKRYQHASELKQDVARVPRTPSSSKVVRGFEWKSKAAIFGWPLLHICFGLDEKQRPVPARGIIAIGNLAFGVLAIGGLSCGGVAMGGVAFGVAPIAGVAIGLLAIGGAAIGGVAVGGVSVGYYALGGAAIGKHCYSGLRQDPEAERFFGEWISLPKNPSPKAAESDRRLVYRIQFPKGFDGDRKSVQEQTIRILERRINGRGLKEGECAPLGDDRVVLHISKEASVQEYLDLISIPGGCSLRKVGTAEVHRQWTETPGWQEKPEATAPVGWMAIKNDSKMSGDYRHLDKDYILVSKDSVATEGDFKNAFAELSLEEGWTVRFELTDEGEEKLDAAAKELYHQNPRGLIAIILNGEIISKPRVKSERFGGSGIINGGGFPKAEADDLAVVLRTGPLPFPLEVVEFQKE